uniref:Cytochrome P450 6PZ16 n=1 Tax=Maconellicoccus hirsutus TaxID=177089 RepID=A0AAT9UTH4_MACHI
METIALLICAIALLLVYFYHRFKRLYSYFDHHGIPYVKPILVFGNTMEWCLMKKSLSMILADIYEKLEPHRFGGLFIGRRKVIIVRDTELIRSILVKDFSSFQDHVTAEDASKEDVLDRNLLSLRGEEWKNLRIKLTGTFTSGKMKLMFPLVRDCGAKMHSVLGNISQDEDILAKEICARYTTDVIGCCAFGLDIDSLNDPNSVFRQMGKRIFAFNIINVLRVMLPKLEFFFDLFHNDKAVKQFFLDLVKKTVKHREEHNIFRGDFLDLLINLKHDNDQKSNDRQAEEDVQKFISQVGGKYTKTHIEMTDELITAQCFLFFAAGFGTSSSTMSYMLLELAQNQHIQDKLRAEIVTVLENNNNELTYEAIKQMKYLDMVINETLRKFPVGGHIDRVCSVPYQIPNSKFTIPEGFHLTISIRGIHYDPKYYERPLEFYPEHFTEQAKAQRPHYTFMPFGGGPRVCIAERFARMEIKVGAVYLLKNMSYHVSPKMKLPVEHAPEIALFEVKGGIWLRCKKLQ